ncbi:patatin-like phospholipase family protein [Echinicola salinicaeni]|uniref:patatin-like phospholipase family protein n=1 Tax=Echinicola salinicaeni TaxID=2762757 RepID=UPI0016458028|nr:patatin-like phospholipase family protein [Echinicola salinicaeni]
MWHSILHSFPVQLLVLHFKKNIALVAIWGLLVLVLSNNFGKVLGIPYLFLDPEYLNEVSWIGFFMMGIGLAVFTMAFHMTTYIMDAARFKFLAVLSRPFIRFCINNSLIPLIAYLVYIISIINFQLDNELESNWEIFRYIIGFLIGNLLTFLFLFAYFALTNKNFFLMFTDSLDKKLRKTKVSRANVIKRYKDRKRALDSVGTYLDIDLRFKEVRPDLSQFEGNMLLKVFDQNHLNLFIIEIALVAIILILGFFRDNELLQFPAGMSVMLMFSILTLLVGAVTFWLRSWSTFAAICIFLIFNNASKTEIMNRPHSALGMNYDTEPAVYNLNRLDNLLHPDTIQKDKQNTIQILDKWREQFPEEEKPKMVLITCSGGGQRAALWTLHVLQQIHLVTEGKFMKHTRLFTGASGGVVGAAFFRELYLRYMQGENIDLTDAVYRDQISADNLNPIIFTLMVNDLLIRNQKVEYNGRKYLQDRGFAFEKQLNINTKGVLDKPLRAYEEPEKEALIPMLPITPLIVNDGRKLFVSPNSMSYMGVFINRLMDEGEKSQAIDFMRFFREQDAEDLRFISALRMGATFPFITPNIQLPSDPLMEIMDSGLSDNFGISDALRFLFVFEDWIAENTSGVLLITIRDSEKILEIEQKTPPTIFQKLVTPLKNIYINWDNVQTLNNETLYNYMKETTPFSLDKVEFEYSSKDYLEAKEQNGLDDDVTIKELEIQRASLNWRLTSKEKKDIIDCIGSRQNRDALKELQTIFEEY